MRKETTKYAVLLWVVQGLLAAVFLLAGGMKLVMPAAMLKGPVPLPVPFLRFIGVAEVAGALGLILPGLLRIRPALTALAAAGLVIIMIGATSLTVASMGVRPAVVPFVTGLLAAAVAYGRRPGRGSAGSSVSHRLQAA
jgi:uncharacterized membrane protein YphA (DoxX/SURF4 family)